MDLWVSFWHWRNPELYEKGYQTLQGLYAIGSGGLFGRGLGESVQKLGFLPEAQNDMIFSIICEELGLVGASLIILLFLILIWRFFVIATRAKDLMGALIAAGSCNEFDTEYWNNASLYQLRRHIRYVPAFGNGACAECFQSDRIGQRIQSSSKGIP